MAIDLIDGGPPFGAVIVDHESGEVMCKGRNRGSSNRIYHGEMDAMINCGDEHPQLDWSRLTLYTTGEPCPMCMSAIIWNRIPRVVYATSIRKLTNIGLNQINLDTSTVAGAASFYSGEIISGILKDSTDKMFEDWMASR
ncbi:nucleoside deaminase [Roseovarius albus]|nr:nucleoside deaminase [Roseovarius albus]